MTAASKRSADRLAASSEVLAEEEVNWSIGPSAARG
jgi:hypothetical protein